MSIVQFRAGRLSAQRAAFRRGMPLSTRFGAALQLVQRQTAAVAYCRRVRGADRFRRRVAGG